MEFDYSKLRGRIKEVLGTEGAFAEKLGRSHNYVSNVFIGKSMFTQKDIAKAVEVLAIPIDDIGSYFFTMKVHKNGTDVA